MDARMARQQLSEVNAALKKLDEERDVLVSLVRGYEGWLRLHGDQPVAKEATTTRRRSSTAPKGSISLRQAVLKVIREAHGEPVHIREILTRALGLGAITTAASPERVIDLVAYNLKTRSDQPLERVSPRSWRWVGN